MGTMAGLTHRAWCNVRLPMLCNHTGTHSRFTPCQRRKSAYKEHRARASGQVDANAVIDPSHSAARSVRLQFPKLPGARLLRPQAGLLLYRTKRKPRLRCRAARQPSAPQSATRQQVKKLGFSAGLLFLEHQIKAGKSAQLARKGVAVHFLVRPGPLN